MHFLQNLRPTISFSPISPNPRAFFLLSSLSAFPSQFPPSSSPRFSVLRAAISASDLRLGKCIHGRILTSGEYKDRYLTNNLITMYSKCGSLTYARHLFDKSPERDLITWNSILAAYAQSVESVSDNVKEGLQIFRLFLGSCVSPSKMTLAPVLKLCLHSGYVWASETIHGYAVKINLDLDEFVSGALVNIYAKFGRIREARVLFEEMPERDLVLWNVMLKAYLEMGLKKEAIFLFGDLQRSDLCPDDVSLHCVLSGISNVASENGRIHMEQIQAYSFKLSLYEEESNTVLWNKTLSEYHQGGKNLITIMCFMKMLKSNVECDSVTFVVVLAAITGLTDLWLGQQIHGRVLKSGFDSAVAVANSLINTYSKLNCISLAQKVFSDMKGLDLITWNSMISSCTQNGLEKESVNLFVDLLRNGQRPDNYTLASVLKACSSLSEGLYLSEQIHVHSIKTGYVDDSFVSTALIDVYSRNGKMEEAELLLRSSNDSDLASSNALMFGYVSGNDSLKALELFSSMHKSGDRLDEISLATAIKACSCLLNLEQGRKIHAYAVKSGLDSDLVVTSGILDLYVKCGDTVGANVVFDDIPAPDDVAWTTMISGCVENGDEDRALSVYHRMRISGIQPDEYTFATLIKASSLLTALEQGRQIHANVIKSDCASDPFVVTSLIDMYAKCGGIKDAYILFRKFDLRNVALWNAMLVGLAQHGNGKEALNLFKVMVSRGIQPDSVTFIGVISACSHSGLIPQAYDYFNSMSENYSISPGIEHYSCLVDALGRAGRVKEAENLIQSMPFEASASMYRALLGACRLQNDTETGKRVAEKLLALEPSDSAAYVLLSNIYAAANQWDDMNNARNAMRMKKVKKDPGFSWIDVKNKVHLFVVDDRTHPESDSIYAKVEEMMQRIKEDGYVPDTDCSLLDVEQEEKENALFYHSEKLAIAYGLIATPPCTSIRVIKNLRVCGDCHNAIKFVSKAFDREIVLRDANRFHRFFDGTCSCGDYW